MGDQVYTDASAVLFDANVNLIVMAAGTGYGVVKNMKTGRHTYMNMAEGEMYYGGVIVYAFTESGLALQATIKGTKFWKDDALN